MARRAQRTVGEALMLIARQSWAHPGTARFRGGVVAALGAAIVLALATYNAADPSFNAASASEPTNLLGGAGAVLADISVQSLGLAAWLLALVMVALGLTRAADRDPARSRSALRTRAIFGIAGALALAGALSAPHPPTIWPLAAGLGGLWGDGVLHAVASIFRFVRLPGPPVWAGILLASAGLVALVQAFGVRRLIADLAHGGLNRLLEPKPKAAVQPAATVARRARPERAARPETDMTVGLAGAFDLPPEPDMPAPVVRAPSAAPKPSGREARENQKTFEFAQPGGFALPELAMLAKPKPRSAALDEGELRQNARLLESVLAEFGVRGQID
jgi:S-DNA-T family DNA segregation ATPase FtsK/SpoIIIE